MDFLEKLELIEESTFFKASALIEKDLQRIEDSEIDLKEKDNFKLSTLKNIFDRKNIIYFGKFMIESPVQMTTSNGEFNLPLIDIQDLNKSIEAIKDKKKKASLSYLHISTIQILIKSTFLKGINSPISIALTDERILHDTDKIIGIVHGNLANVTLKFSVNLGYAIPLREESLNRSISLAYKFHRKDLMRSEDEAFSITYAVSYALTNSHHSIHFAKKERIHMNELFQKISHYEIPRLTVVSQPKEFSLIKDKTEEQNSRHSLSFRSIKQNPLIQPPPMAKNYSVKTSNPSSSRSEIDLLTNQVRDLSTFLKEKF